MTTQIETTEAGQQYIKAYAVHYTTKDLGEAIGQYQGIIAAHPDSPEAGYSRTQILNIAKGLVSKDAFLEAHTKMALAQLTAEAGTGAAVAVP